MKKQSTTSFIKMSTEHLGNLTNIVNETLATGFNQPKSKIFTAADLWNIQRQGKSRTQRRFSF
jgi:hypothetical protein